jgi:hypothetical protein
MRVFEEEKWALEIKQRKGEQKRIREISKEREKWLKPRISIMKAVKERLKSGKTPQTRNQKKSQNEV